MNLSVNVIDDANGVTVFRLPEVIVKNSEESILNINGLLNKSQNFGFYNNLANGGLIKSTQLLNSLGSILNDLSFNNKNMFKLSSNNNLTFLSNLGPEENLNYKTSFRDLPKMKQIYVGYNAVYIFFIKK